MKRTIASLLALVIVLGLAACGSPNKVDVSLAPSGNESTDTGGLLPEQSGSIGWSTDDVDHFARDPYKIVYMCMMLTPMQASLGKAMEAWGERLNFEVEYLGVDDDTDRFNTLIETYAVQGVDGLVVDLDILAQDRTLQILNDSGIPYIGGVTPLLNHETGENIWANVSFSGRQLGTMMTDWLTGSCTEYWGDVDMSKVGYIFFNISVNPDLAQRQLGAYDRFIELYPNSADNYFISDFTSVDFIGQGYNDSRTIIAANPQIEYWIMSAAFQDLALGAARAVTELGLDEKCMIICGDGDVLISEWDNGYEGAWKAAIYVDPEIWTEPIICGLLAMIDGRATAETLWPESKQPGQTYPSVTPDMRIITKETYQSVLQEYSDYLSGN